MTPTINMSEEWEYTDASDFQNRTFNNHNGVECEIVGMFVGKFQNVVEVLPIALNKNTEDYDVWYMDTELSVGITDLIRNWRDVSLSWDGRIVVNYSASRRVEKNLNEATIVGSFESKDRAKEAAKGYLSG